MSNDIITFICKFGEKVEWNKYKCEIDEVTAEDGKTYCQGDKQCECPDVLFINPESGEDI